MPQRCRVQGRGKEGTLVSPTLRKASSSRESAATARLPLAGGKAKVESPPHFLPDGGDGGKKADSAAVPAEVSEQAGRSREGAGTEGKGAAEVTLVNQPAGGSGGGRRNEAGDLTLVNLLAGPPTVQGCSAVEPVAGCSGGGEGRKAGSVTLMPSTAHDQYCTSERCSTGAERAGGWATDMGELEIEDVDSDRTHQHQHGC